MTYINPFPISYREPPQNILERGSGYESQDVHGVDGAELGEECELGKLPNQDEDASQEGDRRNLEKGGSLTLLFFIKKIVLMGLGINV